MNLAKIPKPAIALGVAGVGAGAYFAFFRKPPMTIEQRAAAMARLADDLYKIITKTGLPADRSAAAEEAVKLAIDPFGLTATAAGIKSGAGLSSSEMWPGTSQTVAAYMTAYINLRKPKPPAAPGLPPQPAKVFNDESPVAPFEDPRVVRAQALALEKQGKTLEARVYHTKADTLNNLIKAAKVKNTAVDTFKAIGNIFR